MHVLSKDLIVQLALNICLLSVVGGLVSKIQFVQDLILQESPDWKSQALLSVIFAGMIALSCHTGIMVDGYNMNTKVIGALASGLIGGPLIGLYASFLGSVYVYVSSPLPEFAMASAFATVLFGLLGGGFYPYFQRGKWKYRDLFLVTCFAEICEMITILRGASPFGLALETVLKVSLPMILMNSIGILIFISSFNMVFISQDVESSRQLKRASELMKKCSPLLNEGLVKGTALKEFTRTVLEETNWLSVMITDNNTVLEWQMKPASHPRAKAKMSAMPGGELPNVQMREIETDHKDIYEREMEYFAREHDMGTIPRIGRQAMESGSLTADFPAPEGSTADRHMKDISSIAVPVIVNQRSVGSIIVWMKRQWVTRKSEAELMQYLGMLSSVQLTMTELKHQEIMRQNAEFKALQFQVNPHFLFNALNTISYICRENAMRAKELLLVLSDYFRYNLNNDSYMVPMEKELDHVRDYLEIEKARFEDKLVVRYHVPAAVQAEIPVLILQPIVENAVRYGMGADGIRHVQIDITENPDNYEVNIRDHGKGFPQDILDKLYKGEPMGKSVGLSNVHKRMKSIYGEENGIHIDSSGTGSCVRLRFFRKGKDGNHVENSSY